MNSVRLHYLSLEDGDPSQSSGNYLEDHRLQQCMSELSADKRASLERLVDPRDRLVSLLALRLLKSCVFDEGITDFHLQDICYPEANKPYWSLSGNSTLNGALDFNITHSADLIMAAVSRDVKLGIDAERHRKLKRLNFKMVLTGAELALVEHTEAIFFDIWSKKEAVVKAADTRGIARMRDVILDHGQRQHDHQERRQSDEEIAELDGETWWIMQLDKVIPDQEKADQTSGERGDYSIHMATSAKVDTLIVEKKTIDSLF